MSRLIRSPASLSSHELGPPVWIIPVAASPPAAPLGYLTRSFSVLPVHARPQIIAIFCKKHLVLFLYKVQACLTNRVQHCVIQANLIGKGLINVGNLLSKALVIIIARVCKSPIRYVRYIPIQSLEHKEWEVDILDPNKPASASDFISDLLKTRLQTRERWLLLSRPLLSSLLSKSVD